ncbi:MAG: type II toxin-antitoxin system VapC family toxin [Nocardioides sp.]
MIVLDTTVLVYAKGADHRLREPCRSLLAAVAAGSVEATTTVEVIQEFVHVRARRCDRAEAADLGRGYADLLAPLLSIGSGELRAGLVLFAHTPGIGAFDAVLAGSAMEAGADGLVSADRGFGSVHGLRHVFPDADGVRDLLAGRARSD